MATQGQQIDLLDAIFGNPAVKGALALLTAGAAIVRYVKESGERLSQARAIRGRYGFRGPVFWLISCFPYLMHRLVAIVMLVASIAEVGVLADQYFFNRGLVTLVPFLRPALDFLSQNFVFMFLAAFCFYILFELRAIEQLLAWSIGLVPRFRNSIEWANACWQIKTNADERKVLAASDSDVAKAASDLIDNFAKAERNKNLALRPHSLGEDNAANVLYFGHIIEQYLASTRRSLPWTKFYEALARVAETNEAPLSPEGVSEFGSGRSFLAELRKANAHLEAPDKIPNDTELEHAVEQALGILRSRYQSDARNVARGVFHATYFRILRECSSFLASEGMRRQFAKLFILWNIVPGSSHPEIFQIPFNAKMFTRYADMGVIRFEGARFDYTTEAVQICFDAIQKRILSRVLSLVQSTRDPARVAWRDQERVDVQSRGIDWNWWIYYRADQQAYHDARGHTSENWKIEANQEIVAK